MKFWKEHYREYNYELLDHIHYDKWGYVTTLTIGLMKDKSVYARYEVIFSGCTDIQIDVHGDPDELDESADIIDIQPGMADYVLPAMIHTDLITLTIKYKSVSATRTL